MGKDELRKDREKVGYSLDSSACQVVQGRLKGKKHHWVTVFCRLK